MEERLRETFTTPYPTSEEDSEWSALISAFATQFEELSEVRENVEKTKFVDDATGVQLNKLATLFQLEREAGESDEVFRTRIKASLRAQLSSGTNEDIRTAAAALLDTDTSVVNIVERNDARPTVAVVTPVDDFSEIKIPGDVWDEILNSVTAAGVDLQTVISIETFTISLGRISVQNETISTISDFHGDDSMDGAGAFGAGDVDDPFGQTASSYDMRMEASEPDHKTLSAKQTGSSALGVGRLDGEGDETDVFGETIADPYSVIVSFLETTNTTLSTDHFGTDAFDGAGAFGAGDADSPVGTTAIAKTLTITWSADSTTNVSDGFGSGSFNGSGAFN